jgi:hypothetical protein
MICLYYNQLEGVCKKGCGRAGVKKNKECPFIHQEQCSCYKKSPSNI